MDDLWSLTGEQNAALVMLAFLQVDCRNSEFREELLSLDQEISLNHDINCNGRRNDALDDGDLECDGHLPSCIATSLHDLQPLAELQWPRNHVDAAAFQQVAEELKEIAAQLENSVVARATQNLSKNIRTSPFEEWKKHLSFEVDRAMRQGVILKDLPREGVIMALTLTLVKGVCEQTPRLLRNLFNTALQFISNAR